MKSALFLIVLIFVASRADATLLKSEPGEGQLRPGERVLVDDGSCPAGQIEEVIRSASLIGSSMCSGAIIADFGQEVQTLLWRGRRQWRLPRTPSRYISFSTTHALIFQGHQFALDAN